MMLDVSHLNLKFEHVKGIKNCTTDFRSRKPRDSFEAISEDDCQVRLRLGIKTVKSQELQLEPVDTRLEILAEVAMDDSKYQRMLYHTEEATPLEYIEEDCELSKMGSERKNLSIYTCSNGFRLLIRNSEEVVVPECARAEVLN